MVENEKQRLKAMNWLEFKVQVKFLNNLLVKIMMHCFMDQAPTT